MNSKNRPPLPRYDVTSSIPEVFCLILTRKEKERMAREEREFEENRRKYAKSLAEWEFANREHENS